jgi:hypothetical protein
MKKSLIFVFGIALILVNGFFVSGICCEKLKSNGLWCQDASNAGECDSDYYTWTGVQTCTSVLECYGTCVNLNSGECSENTPKTTCQESDGIWHEESSGEISECQEVCCLIGEDAYFINPTECKAMFTTTGIQGVIREDITSRSSCEAMSTHIKIGACVISSLSQKTCVMSTNLDCTSDKISDLADYLDNSPELNQIDIEFHEGLLCTAPGISDCAKSENTECKNNKVYYKDTCGNFANVYDSGKYSNVNYWTYIQDPYGEDACSVSTSGSSTCGNCEPAENTVCKEYEGASNKPSHNSAGLVCGDLSCRYKGKTYEHGESWCAEPNGLEVSGTLVIEENLTTGEISEDSIKKLKDQDKYNLPGSRYYKLVCSYGEVLVEECGDYRHSVCIQGENEDGTSLASCAFNNWRTCFQITTKTECEDPSYLCKWIPGYRWDGAIVAEKDRKEQQGSCVPLIAPGFDFWEGDSQGNAICSMASAQENVLFETSWKNSRDNFADWSDKTHAHQCIDRCYAIPFYAMEFNQKPGEEKQYPEEIHCPDDPGCTPYDILTEFYDESEFKLPQKVKEYHLSLRRGQYCHKDGKPDQWLTGGVSGQSYDCTPGTGSEAKDERKERDYPIYLTNDEWITSITERARSLGDCGYKMGVNGEYSDPGSEIITAIFQKLSQKGNVKENLTVEQIIYKGGKFVDEPYEIELPHEAETYNCADTGGICTSTINNPELCLNGEQNAEGTCPDKMVCCVYPDELGVEETEE